MKFFFRPLNPKILLIKSMHLSKLPPGNSLTRMMPMRRTRDKSCLGNSAKLHRPGGPNHQPTGRRTGVTWGVKLPSPDRTSTSTTCTDLRLRFLPKKNMVTKTSLICWGVKFLAIVFVCSPFASTFSGAKNRWSAAIVNKNPNFSATADSSLVLSPILCSGSHFVVLAQTVRTLGFFKMLITRSPANFRCIQIMILIAEGSIRIPKFQVYPDHDPLAEGLYHLSIFGTSYWQ